MLKTKSFDDDSGGGGLVGLSFATFGQWRWLIGVYPTVADTELDSWGTGRLGSVERAPSELRRSLVDRFQRELAGGSSPLKSEDATESVDLEAYGDQIASNIELLMRLVLLSLRAICRSK